MQLDINQLDMEGIIDSRVNTASNGHSAPFESPIDITRAPWDVTPASRGAGPSGLNTHPDPSGSGINGGVNGTPFSTLNPFGSPPRPTPRNGKGRAPSSISPKDILPSTSPFDLSGYTIPETMAYSVPGPSNINPLHSINTNILNGAHTQSAVSPHWQAPDSWATIPRENERLDNVDESSDEDVGNAAVRRPSFAPLGDSIGGNRKSPSTTLNARAREKSLPQTPMSPGFDRPPGQPAQVTILLLYALVGAFTNALFTRQASVYIVPTGSTML